MESARRVIAILGAGGTLGAALSRTLAAEPDTDLVLSDLSEEALAEAGSAKAVETLCELWDLDNSPVPVAGIRVLPGRSRPDAPDDHRIWLARANLAHLRREF